MSAVRVVPRRLIDISVFGELALQHRLVDNPVMDVVHLDENDWELLRELRLAAFRESPNAFASTLQEALALTEVDWRRRLVSCDWFVAKASDGRALGLGGAMKTGRGQLLIGMWVDPHARGQGVAQALVEERERYAIANGANGVRVRIAEGNLKAQGFYERIGFERNGYFEPLREGSEVTVYEYSRPG